MLPDNDIIYHSNLGIKLLVKIPRAQKYSVKNYNEETNLKYLYKTNSLVLSCNTWRLQSRNMLSVPTI